MYDWKSIAMLSGVVVATFVACQQIEHYYDSWRAKHPRAYFFDPRSDGEKFMNSCGYIKHYYSCPLTNPNPDSMFGKFATKYNYFKAKGR